MLLLAHSWYTPPIHWLHHHTMSLQTGNQNGHENQPIKLMTTPKTVFKHGCGLDVHVIGRI